MKILFSAEGRQRPRRLEASLTNGYDATDAAHGTVRIVPIE
jgi:hypothetical protein